MACSTEYAPQLRSLGFRVTSQRMAILHVLREAGGHLSPTDILARARRASPGITPTTVYRSLEVLNRIGLVWKSSHGKGRLAYELAETHHHHLICRECGRELELPEPAVRSVFKKLEALSGYTIDHEHTSLTGRCPSCRAASTKKPAG